MVSCLTLAWLSFAQPWWLAGLLAAGVPVGVAMIGRRRGRHVPVAAVAAQCLAVTLAVAALARPIAPIGPRARLPILTFVDASGSLRGQWPDRTIRLPADAPAERYYFAASLSRARPASGIDDTRATPVLEMIAARARDGLAAAIVATDGRFSDDWTAPAEAVARAGATVLIVPANAPPPDGRIVSVRALRASGRSGRVDVTVTVEANAPMRRALALTGGDIAPTRQAASLLPDLPAAYRAAATVPPGEAAMIAARLEGDAGETDAPDAFPENDRAAAMVLPEVRTVAAIGDAAAMAPMLSALDLPIVRWRPPPENGGSSAPPDSPAGLSAFAAVIVLDPEGASLSAAQRRALAEYARRGGGVVMIGVGPHASPADRDDPLNLVLPLAPDPFQRRPLHLTVLLDRSASMGRPAPTEAAGQGQVKFDLATEATLALKDHLTARDGLTVIAFANDAETLYDSGSAGPDFAALAERLRRVEPTGPSTRVTPALAEALRRPPQSERTPMILVLSDLATEEFDPAAWAGKIAQAKARLAVVTVGAAPPGDTPPPLERLARQAPEASYTQRADLKGLAEVFAALVRRGRGDIVRKGAAPLQAVGPLFDTGLEKLPDAEAILLTAERERADVLVRSAGGEPIVARRTTGLGRTVSVALPVAADVNAEWSRSPEAATLVAGAVRWSARPAADERFEGVLSRVGASVQVAIAAREGDQTLDGLELKARLADGDQLTQTALLQVAPGRYEGRLPVRPDAPAVVDVVDAEGAVRWRGQLPEEPPPEYRRIGADRDALRRLAALTGGRLVRPEHIAEVLVEVRRESLTELWPLLAAAALAVMLVEWCTTRVTRR